MQQGKQRILFICKATRFRSAAAEELYRDDPRYEVRKAGIAPHSERRVTQEDLAWADRVFVMGTDVMYGIEHEELYQSPPVYATWKWPELTVLKVRDVRVWPPENREIVIQGIREAVLEQLRPYLGNPHS